MLNGGKLSDKTVRQEFQFKFKDKRSHKDKTHFKEVKKVTMSNTL